MKVDPSFRPIASLDKLWGVQTKDAIKAQSEPRRLVVDMVRLFVACRIPITLWGPIGARKTRTLQALAKEVDENGVPYQVITIQPSTEDPTVIHGMMYVVPDVEQGALMRRSIPDVANQVTSYHEETGGLSVMFLDEMTTCMPAQQHALLGLLTHGHYGDVDIGPLTVFVMAANPEGTVSTVNELGEQVLNRGGHVPWYGDVGLFLEEYKVGFGTAAYAPTSRTYRFIHDLLHTDVGNAFRNDRWKPDELVPWDLLEHTERTTTELGRMMDFIMTIMADESPAIRNMYIVEAAKALQGNEWAERAQGVLSTLKTYPGTEDIKAELDLLMITHPEAAEDGDVSWLDDQEWRTIIEGPDKRTSMTDVEQLEEMLLFLKESSKTDYDLTIHLAAWVLVSGRSGGMAGMLKNGINDLVIGALAAASAGTLNSRLVLPPFISEELRESVASVFRQSS